MGNKSGKMENLVTDHIFNTHYKGKKVLVTGHTGFKGSWLVFWLKQLGAEVTGLALSPSTHPSHFELLKPDIKSFIGDIRDFNFVKNSVEDCKPDIIFHLAAQPLVIESYKNPIYTYETNVIGTLNLLEACKSVSSVRAIVCITTDKVYENKELNSGYNETDKLGGYDMYSSSKACAEILISSFRDSFFNTDDWGTKHNLLIASARAGNVIGGGDWGDNRLIPDIVKATHKNEIVQIRFPDSIRPWQHVLEPLRGYLMLGEKLLNGKKEFACAWNFGPADSDKYSVQQIIGFAKNYWSDIRFNVIKNELHEAPVLRLDSSKANTWLGWKQCWDIHTTLEKTINWYKDFYLNKKINTESDLMQFIKDIH